MVHSHLQNINNIKLENDHRKYSSKDTTCKLTHSMVFAWHVGIFRLGSQYGTKSLICRHIAYNASTGLHQFCSSPV